MNRKGLIVVNGFYRPETVQYQIRRFRECFAKLGVEISVSDNQSVGTYLNGLGVTNKFPESDFVLYLDKDKHIAYMLERAGLRLFNSVGALELCDDKIRTYIALSDSGIRMPKTVSSPILYSRDSDDSAFLVRLENLLPYPMVVKEAFGSLGMQVHLAENREQLAALRKELKFKPHLYQEYLGARHGCDVRIMVVGGKAASCMLRQSEGDFRSNIALGGTASKFTPEPEFLQTAEQAAAILGLDYCGVDLLFGANGEPVLCEVNSNAFLSASEQVTGVDIAGRYAEYITHCVYNR